MPVLDRTLRRQLVQRRRLVETVLASLIVLGALLLYFAVTDRPAFLSFFFLPVCLGAVLSGRVKGLMLAAMAVAVVILPLLVRGPEFLSVEVLSSEQVAMRVVAWALSLSIAAYLIGLVSEVGGNRVLVLGVADDAISSVERERKRMAFDIHDGIAQTANTALMQANVMEMMVADCGDVEIEEQAQQLQETLSSAVTEIRTMIGNLRPPTLNAEEFPSTLQRLVEDFAQKTGIKVELDLDAELTTVSDSVRICLYRVAQEALSNIEQHAEASRAWIGVNETKGGVFLSIADDGIGFDAETAREEGRHGLAGMQERVWLLTGRIQIESRPAHGTRIRAYIPRYLV